VHALTRVAEKQVDQRFYMRSLDILEAAVGLVQDNAEDPPLQGQRQAAQLARVKAGQAAFARSDGAADSRCLFRR
jgi:hypothetical protein